jgi:hypothetical protein
VQHRHSDVAQLILHLICGYVVENDQSTTGHLVRRAAHGDDNAVMSLPGDKVLLGQGLKVIAVVGQ